jgi:hypothetical protein
MKRIIFLILILVPCVLSAQTRAGSTVAYAVDPDIIMVAAPDIICHKGLFGAAAGLQVYHEFNVDSLIIWAADQQKDFDSRIALLKDTIRKVCQKFFRDIIKDEGFSDHFDPSNGVVAEVLVWSATNRKLRYAHLGLLANQMGPDWSIHAVTLDADSSLPPRGFASNMMGISDSAQTFKRGFLSSDLIYKKIMSDPNFQVEGNHKFDLSPQENRLYYLVYVETKRHPGSVRMPIEAVQTSGKGQVAWLYNPLKCSCSQ